MSILADRESRLLIDGKLVEGSGGTFETVNPATEEVLGVAANADESDMSAAIGAARTAFDDTDWSTNTELRVRCLRQLREAMSADFDAAYRAHVGPWFRWGSLRYYTPSVWMYQYLCRAEVEKNAGVRMPHSRQATYGSAVTSP